MPLSEKKKALNKTIDILAETIYRNRYIPESHREPLFNQKLFLTYTGEELFYGGAAGGGKSDALLMGALQYYKEPLYDALIIRRTYTDLSQSNSIMDRCEQWLMPYIQTGEIKYNRLDKKFTFPSGATLTFGYLANDRDLNRYQGGEWQYIGIDEATQLSEKQIRYLHSRLRKTTENPVPLRIRYAGNPGGLSNDYFKDTFVYGDLPFIPSSYRENIYLDTVEYEKQLDKLDELTKQRLKNGSWDITLSSGLLMDLETYNNRKVTLKEIVDWKPVYTSIGIDPASTGNDRFSMACLTYFDNGCTVIMDLDSTQSSKPEQRLKDFIIRNSRYHINVINFEREPGSSDHYALKYWKDILRKLSYEYGFRITNTSASSTGNKFERAYHYAYHIRNGDLLINKDIPVINEDNTIYNPVDELGNQLVYLHPDKEVMKDHRSPDESDSVSYAYIMLPIHENNTVQAAGKTQRYRI
jgi:hypothetical protein